LVNFCGLLRIPYVRDNRYRVTVFDHDRHRGGIIGVELSFGFMEEPNVERACCAGIAERDRLITMNEKLRQLLRKAQGFEAKSERLAKLHPDQLNLALEDIEQTIAKAEAIEEKSQAADAPRKRRINRSASFSHPSCSLDGTFKPRGARPNKLLFLRGSRRHRGFSLDLTSACIAQGHD
jgi:hypothetical protein